MAFLLSRNLKYSFLHSIKILNMNLQKRNLFSPEILGIENYIRQKELMISKVGSVRDKFMERMKHYVAESEENAIYLDDMKMGVYLAENDKELETVISMVKRFHLQNDSQKFSSFIFGPLVLRLLYILNKPDIAKDLFFDQNMSNFFSQVNSYLVFFDLMFINERYDDILQAMHQKVNEMEAIKFSMDCLTLYAAACYKLNTFKSFELLFNFLQNVRKNYSTTLSMRTVIYGAMFALKQNQPERALEILSMIHIYKIDKKPIVFINVELLTYAKLNRFDEIVSILMASTQKDLPETSRSHNAEIFEHVLTQVRKEFDERASKLQQSQLADVTKNLERYNCIDARPFELYIFSNIEKQRTLQAGYKRRQRPISYFNKKNQVEDMHYMPTLLDIRLK